MLEKSHVVSQQRLRQYYESYRYLTSDRCNSFYGKNAAQPFSLTDLTSSRLRSHTRFERET
jgi:hypothetical protein